MTFPDMNSKTKSVLKIISTVLIMAVIVLAMLLVGARIFGLKIYTVLSPSMEPAYMTGSVIYVKSVDPDELKERDVITFKLTENSTATHRIIELVEDKDDPNIVRFRTQGDNNDTPDGSFVEKSDVIGTPVFSIPYLGYVAAFIQQPPGSYIAIAISIALITFVIVIDGISDDKSKKSDSNKK